MILTYQTSNLACSFGIKNAIKMIKEAGFDAYDMSLFEMEYDENNVFNTDAYLETAKDLRKYSDELGIKCGQAHAPFPSSVGDRKKDAEIFGKIVRSMEIASILGAKNIVVHPKQHIEYAKKGNQVILEEMNIDFYRSLIPYCEKFNIHAATENMFQWDGINNKALDSTCSSKEEFCRYVDRIGSKWIVACLDIGHSPLVGRDPAEIARALGHDRLKALHIHDNDGRFDLHSLPFTVESGKSIDFEEITQALADINYDGDFTFEADNFLARMPDELKFDAIKFAEKVGRRLIKMIEEKSK